MRSAAPRLAVVALLAGSLVLATTLSAEPPKAAAPAAGAGKLAKEDEQAIRRTIMGFEESWNAHDMKELGLLFTPDADWINIVGMRWKGREAIVAAHTAFHQTMFKNHEIKTDAIDIRPLGSDYALAVVTTTNDAFTTPAGQAMPKAQDLQTYVLTRTPEGWKVVHGHNVVINAEAVKHDPVKAAGK